MGGRIMKSLKSSALKAAALAAVVFATGASAEQADSAAAAKEFAKFIPAGYKLAGAAKGDLNKDGLQDWVLMVQATDRGKIGEYFDCNRYGIIILFNKGGRYEAALQNLTQFSPLCDEDGEPCVPGSPEYYVNIDRGNLILGTQYLRGSYEYTFRYKNADFELIGEDGAFFQQGNFESTSINYLTKKKKSEEGSTDEGAQKSVEWENITVKSLRKLSEIKTLRLGVGLGE
jgi:hypothetical protein